MLLSYLMLVIYISVPVCTLCGRGENIDEKYDECILYFLSVIYSGGRWLRRRNPSGGV